MSPSATTPITDVANPFGLDVDMNAAPVETPETPVETPETPVEPAAPEPTPAATPDPTPVTPAKQKEPSRSQLAAELEAKQKELEALRNEGQSATQKYQDEVARRAELEKKIEELDKGYVQASTPVYDWQKDPEVAGPRREITTMLQDALPDLEDPEAKNQFKQQLPAFLNAYVKARSETDGLDAYKKELVEKFGEDGKQMFSLLRQMVPKHIAALEAQGRNSQNHFERTATEFDTRSRLIREEYAKIGREAAPDDDIGGVIAAVAKGDEELLKQIDAITSRAAMGTAGLPPLPANAAPEVIEKHRLATTNRGQFMERFAFRRDAEARILAAAVKKLSSELEVLRKRAGASSAANRPGSGAPDTTPKEEKATLPQGVKYDEVMNPFASAARM